MVKIWLLRVGIVVLRSISGVATPPSVSIESVSGVTSSSRMSLTSPPSTPPWIAAPIATTSSGLMPLCGSLPKKLCTLRCTAGMRVWPPTRIASSISPLLSPASFSAASIGGTVRSIRRLHQLLELGAGQGDVEVLRAAGVGRDERQVDVGLLDVLESSILAFSAASFRRCRAIRSLRRSIPSCFLNSSARKSMITWSKSSPPRCVSPLVACTWKTPSERSRIEMS